MDGDSEGAMEMTIRVACNTLGLTKDELSEKLEGVCSDGVYQDTRDRVFGGGSLSLVANLSAELFPTV